MIELSDTQAVVLSNTSQREDRSLLSLPASLKVGGGTTKAIGVQIKHGLAEEHQIHDLAKMRRNEGDLNYGLFLTATGAAAIGLPLHDTDASDGEMDEAPAPATSGKGFAPPVQHRGRRALLHRQPPSRRTPWRIRRNACCPTHGR